MSDYKFTKASLAAVARKGNNPKNQYVELFQKTLDEQFYNSSDWWTVKEEVSIGSRTYRDIDVRVTHLINAETGLKLGDDWKTLLFKEINHAIELGKLYVFDDNTWLTTNTEFYKNLAGTCTVRRCNNTLRWIDEASGAYYEEPCAIEYLVKEPRNYATQGSPFITPGGFLHIEAQFNERTNLIKQNQRFLLGNPGHWSCYMVVGTGLNDFRNQTTYDNDSAKVLSLDLVANFVNDELDDIINGVADVNTNVYTVTLDKSHAEGYSGSTIQLFASVTYNGDSVTRDMTWATSNAKVATVSGSGLVTLKSIGNCTITANVENNTASDTCSIAVTNTPIVNTDVRITPDINYILEGSQKTYTVYLYKDDVQQADGFTITCNGNSVPASSYIFAQTDANHFTISNILRSVTSYLTIQCVSGTNTKSINIFLKGG